MPVETMTAKLIPLDTWAAATYGEHAPTIDTLRRWARDGMLQPPAEKHGRVYMVSPDASYVPLAQRKRLVNRIPKHVPSSAKCA